MPWQGGTTVETTTKVTDLISNAHGPDSDKNCKRSARSILKFTKSTLIMCLKLTCPLALLVLIVTILPHHNALMSSNSIDERQTRQQLVPNPSQDGNSSKCLDQFGDEFKRVQNRLGELKENVQKIIKYVIEGPGKGSTYDELSLFVDTFGPRMSGSPQLEQAVEYLRLKMQDESHLKVTAEPAIVPNWQLISQSCEMSEPRQHSMSILTLGQSVSTDGTLEAPVELVHDFDELDQLGKAERLHNKIVVFNFKWISYGTSVKYRTQGALRASKFGAAAALIRSVTPFSINSPHTGAGSKSIPTASITVEDANFIERLIKRNQTVLIKLNIQTKHLHDAQSYNLVGDIRGSTRPNEVVFVSGHMDSWYVTSGAIDDGGGMMISYKALDVLSKLGLRADRTMRAVLFTAEEPGLVGAQQYFNQHKHELDNFKVVIESDLGTFNPLGLGYTNLGPLGKCVLNEALKLTESMNTTQMSDRFEGSDIELFADVGVPGLSLFNENSQYFYYHHTAGDSLDLEDPTSLDKCTALFASALYILANLDVDLRR